MSPAPLVPLGLGGARFEVRRWIGSGGFGVVYEAFDHQRGMVVALKTLREVAPDALYRLKREFRALADVSHPNLVTLHELLHDDGRWFFTMELVAGTDFIEHVRGGAGVDDPLVTDATTVHAPIADALADPGAWSRAAAPALVVPLDLDRLRAALAQLATGLDVLHQAGKLHCDIKPSNVLVEAGGRVVLLDFSLVTDRGGEAGAGGGFAGTPAYAAPEQASGGAVSPAVDWYGVGVMLYEALTARLPFAGSAVQVLTLKQQLDPSPPRELALGVPDDLDRLCLALLARDPGRRPTGAEVRAALRAGDARPRSRGRGPDELFFGRAAELAILRAGLARAASGQLASVLVRGPSGVGKSALIERFIAEVGGALVLPGRCYLHESVPFRAVDAAVDALARALTASPGVADAVPDELAGALVRLFPVLGQVARFAAAPPPSAGAEPERVRQHGFAGLRLLLAALARRQPVVITIDDLQWADADSHALLREVFADDARDPRAGGAGPPAVLLIATARDTTPVELVPGAQALGLGPLAPVDAAALARAVTGGGSAAAAARIAAESAGLPLFIRELAQAGPQELGIGLDASLRLRVARSAPAARALCELLAVAGVPLSARTLTAAAGLDVGALARVVADLRADGLVRVAGAGDLIALHHDRIREAVVDGLVAGEQAERHGRLADALIGTGVADERPELVVAHLVGAGRAAAAAGYALRGARRAAASLAFEQAASLLRTALAAPPAGESARALRIELATALSSARRGAEAAAEFLLAADGAELATAIDCRRQAAEQLLTSGHVERGIALIGGVLAAFDRPLPRTPAAALAELIYQRARLRLRGHAWTPRPRAAIAASDQRRFELLRSVAFGLGMIDNVRGAVYQTRALALALALGEPSMVGRALGAEAIFRGTQGRGGRRAARALIAEASAIAARHGDPLVLAWAQAAAGVVGMVGGDLVESVDQLAEVHALFLARTAGTAWEINTVLLSHCLGVRLRGDFAALAPLVDEHVRDATRRHDRYVDTSLRRGATVLHLVRDQPAAALASLAATAWSPYQAGFHLQHWFELEALGEHDLYVGAATGAVARLGPRFRAMDRALLTRVQLFRALAWWLEARLLLADRAIGAIRTQARCAYLAARLAAEQVSYATVWSHLVRAGAAAGRADAGAVTRWLEAAIAGADRGHLALCGAMARLRLADRVGGARGADLRRQAAGWIAAEGVRDPARLARIACPVADGQGRST